MGYISAKFWSVANFHPIKSTRIICNVSLNRSWRTSSLNFNQFRELTLFPRVSETSETNLRIQGTPFREHLVEHGFFQYAELVILTLMKGDERIQTVEECTDSALLGDVWMAKKHIRNIFIVNVHDRFALSSFR